MARGEAGKEGVTGRERKGVPDGGAGLSCLLLQEAAVTSALSLLGTVLLTAYIESPGRSTPEPGLPQGVCHCSGEGSAGNLDLPPRLRVTVHELVLQMCVCTCVCMHVCACVLAHVYHMPSFACPHVQQSGPPFLSLHPRITEKPGAPSQVFPDSHLPPPQGDT